MKLKTLTIKFSTNDEFLKDVKDSLFDSNHSFDEDENSLSFDSIETFKNTLTENRLDILMAIARERPESIYQLAKYLNREHPHVTKDCKILEFLGFIVLEEAAGAKKQFTPRLVFDYDFIVVKDKMEKIFSISKKSNEILLKSMVS
jgi:predicted transcriptional regulator